MANLKRINDDKIFENILREYFQSNSQYSDTAKIKYTENEQKKINENMDFALRYRKLKEMMMRSDVSGITFSQNIYDLRIKNKFSKEEMGKILSLNQSTIDRLESGNQKINVFKENIIADILSKLRITINKYIQMLKNELYADSIKSQSLTSFARSKSNLSTDERSKKMKHGIDAVMLEISKRKNKTDKIEINPDHIQNIEKYLKKMGERELLQ